jgi:hypothetical protein
MIARSSDKFPPEQVKELIGSLAIAVAKSTDPANKLSLTSSRVSMVLGVMKIKCRDWVAPGLYAILYSTLQAMIQDMQAEHPQDSLTDTLNRLEFAINGMLEQNSKEKTGYMIDESLELIADYNAVLECRERWKIANDVYMQNEAAWVKSNKMLADIHDKLTEIELKYNLIIVPKNYSFNVNDLGIFNKQKEGEETG